jgi:F-type H+-transporting ATP synthase subunit e
LRYSALLFGVFYGFSHQRTIYANAKAANAEHEYKHKEALIQKAKAEFAKKNLPPQAKTADGGGEFPGVVQSELPLMVAPHPIRSKVA